ncbi:ATP-dependent Clp protease proteolytic subunit [Rhynchospora pubera]|uniref:ATP-dependent Clp protease proteolytic subunit n=1 Tax=Rhynchospora pubera TaxID=906938 RepID=A0AAV8F2T1_9POAL|nr:ATP-dependent Clp protease proteolytic subunit [Rhynchospora pubera]KAJ4778068.1 ATP-dependent Clp protease proteolytic subunit [Rhynchospora pubera]KAJ4784938.1 ATP-dependent Clp protease proteolytic subunit [Rhynchospora pubera]
MASLSISTPIKPSFLRSTHHRRSHEPRPFYAAPKRASPRIQALSSSSQFESPFLSALEAPVSTGMGGGSDAMGLLMGERIVFLGGEITELMADVVLSQLLLLDAQDHSKDIRLYINSSGGSLSATMAIYDVIQMVKSDVSTIAVGTAASNAALILGSGTRGKRFAMPNARIMLHQPTGSASGHVRLVEYHAIELLRNKNNVIRLISGFTGRPFSQVKKEIDRDLYMGSAEAVAYGIIDGILDEDKMIPIQPVVGRVKPKIDYADSGKNPSKYLRPEIPDDEIY